MGWWEKAENVMQTLNDIVKCLKDIRGKLDEILTELRKLNGEKLDKPKEKKHS